MRYSESEIVEDILEHIRQAGGDFGDGDRHLVFYFFSGILPLARRLRLTVVAARRTTVPVDGCERNTSSER